MKDNIDVLLVDDHSMLMDGLATLIELKRREDVQINIVGKAISGETAVEAVKTNKPDVILMDVKMDGIDGIEAARKIKELDEDIKIIILSNYSDRKNVARALKAGVEGYLLKDTPFDSLVQTIIDISHGNVLISPHLIGKLSDVLSGNFAEEESDADLNTDIPDLSVREREILYLLARGKSNDEIAEELFISEKTVRNYISRIYEIIGVKNRAQAVLWVIEMGIGQ